MELISLQALQRVKPVPPLPYRVRVCVLLSVALAVAQGKTNFFVHQRASNTSSCGSHTACSTHTRVARQEKRVSEYAKANVMASVQSSDSIMSKGFSLEADF